MIATSPTQTFDAVVSPYWAWDDKSGRYRDRSTGRYLSQQNLAALQRKHIAAIERDIQIIGDLLLRGQISLRTWQEATATSIKTLWLHQLILSRGGVKQATSSDYLAVGRELKQQYGWLKQFAIDLQRGYSLSSTGQQTPMTPARFKARLSLYAKAGRISYEQGKQEVAKSQGKLLMRRLLGITDRHCQNCLDYAAVGVRPVGTLPLPGVACSCRSNCLCRVVYYGSLAEAIAGLKVT